MHAWVPMAITIVIEVLPPAAAAYSVAGTGHRAHASAIHHELAALEGARKI